jgi:hypothetical protein
MLDKANTSNTKADFFGENEIKPIRYKTDNNIDIIFRKFFKKKIRFNSAFDHKGSKQFLKSKKLALQHIIIDENNSSSNESDTQNESNKRAKSPKLKHPKTTVIKKVENRAKSSNNIFFLKHDNLKNKAYETSNNKNKKLFVKSLVTKELNINKKINKFFSSQELKMFHDKEINKIKPIKNYENNSKINKENKQKLFPFVESDNNKSIDSSLFNMVSQM